MNAKYYVKHITKLSTVRKTNRTIDKISKDIETLRSSIKTKVNSSHFQ